MNRVNSSSEPGSGGGGELQHPPGSADDGVDQRQRIGLATGMAIVCPMTSKVENAWPFTVVIGSGGVVAQRKMGKVSADDLAQWMRLK